MSCQSFVDDFALSIAKLNVEDTVDEYISQRKIHHLQILTRSYWVFPQGEVYHLRLKICSSKGCGNIMLDVGNFKHLRTIKCEFCECSFCEDCVKDVPFKKCEGCKQWSCGLGECDPIDQSIKVMMKGTIESALGMKVPLEVCKVCKDTDY
jgi:hypothetical protein